MIKTIDSLQDVKSFVRTIVKEGVNFHPDDDFNDMINFENKLQFYSESEAAERNRINEQCFEYCELNDLDYYSIALEIFNKETGLKDYKPNA
ncbi:MAG: hypothetical protein ACOC2U_00380 [bacterium]